MFLRAYGSIGPDVESKLEVEAICVDKKFVNVEHMIHDPLAANSPNIIDLAIPRLLVSLYLLLFQ